MMTTISNLTTFTGTVPNKETQSDDDYALSVFPFLYYCGDNLIADINTNFVPKLNALAGEIEGIGNQVSTDKEAVLLAKQATLTARDEAVNAVSALPDGTVNDATTSATDTWSSQKVSNELSNKASNSDLATKTDLSRVYASALCF